MQLRAWNTVHRVVQFDPSTGRGRARWTRASRWLHEPVHGFAAAEREGLFRSQWFAVYRNGAGVTLNAGARSWDLTQPGLSLQHSPLGRFTARFLVQKEGQVDFQYDYHFLGRRMFAVLDPTYDAIDHEAAFFLHFMAMHGTDDAWLERVMVEWTPVD